jgi:aspartate-semialdehyde dehydrogenase
VNANELSNIKKGIVANPNCVAIPLCVALKPLHDIAKVKRVIVATYQSSSGKGATGLQDFEQQLGSWIKGEKVTPTAHRGQLVGNVITLDWTLDPNGYTEEENKVVNETKKILGDQTIAVSPTCVRVPVRVAHSEAINVEFERPISVEQAKAALAKAPGIVLMDETKGEFPQPIHAAGQDHTFVGRVRKDPGHPNALNLWVVADNLRKGAATNAVQVAEELIRRGIVR